MRFYEQLKAWGLALLVFIGSLIWVLLSEKPYRQQKWQLVILFLLLIAVVYSLIAGQVA